MRRTVSRTDQRRAAAEKREELKPLKRRIDAAEQTVARLTAEIAAIDAQLADRLVRARSRQGDRRCRSRAPRPPMRSRRPRRTG